MRGWRCAPLKGPIKIREMLYGSHREKEDHLAVFDPNNGEACVKQFSTALTKSSDIEAIGALEVDLSDIDRKHFIKIHNKRTNKWYLRMEYEVRVSFAYPQLMYEIIIPRNGQFPDAESWGDDPIRKPAVLNCAAAIDVTRPEALDDHVSSPSRVSSAPVHYATSRSSSTTPELRYLEPRGSQQSPERQWQEKSCQRCHKLKAKCIRGAFGRPCYKCIRAREQCVHRF